MTDLVDRTKQEIADRLKELKPLVEEAKRLEVAASSLDDLIASSPASTAPSQRVVKPSVGSRRGRGVKIRPKVAGRKRRRVSLSANQGAIIAALGHGPHTVRELVVVTAMSDQTARNNLKGLVGLEMVAKTERGGKAAYGLGLAPSTGVARAPERDEQEF